MSPVYDAFVHLEHQVPFSFFQQVVVDRQASLMKKKMCVVGADNKEVHVIFIFILFFNWYYLHPELFFVCVFTKKGGAPPVGGLRFSHRWKQGRFIHGLEKACVRVCMNVCAWLERRRVCVWGYSRQFNSHCENKWQAYQSKLVQTRSSIWKMK